MKRGFSSILAILTGLAVIVVVYYAVFYPKPAPAGKPVVTLTPSPEPSGMIVGGDRDEHGCIGSAGYSWCEIKQKCLRVWEEPCDNTPTVDETETIKAAVKAAIVAKRGADAAALTYTVSKVEGDYAQGGASGSGGGGMWFAAKINGKWTLVWDGNGVILCSDIAPYPDFPKTMVSECWDNTANKNVVR